MRTPPASELLDAWEQGLSQPRTWRAIALLAAACPGVPLEALAQLRIGQRDACLLTLRERLFGRHLAGLAKCPVCAEQLDLKFDVTDIRAAESSVVMEDDCQPEAWALAVDGYEILFRLPDSYDLALLPPYDDPKVTREWLLQRCIISARHAEAACSLDQLPAELAEAVAEQMGAADPQGNVELALTCPVCAHGWTVAFDIASFFWAEVNTWALRTLHEVHVLAQAYGWRQTDILALTPWRRQFYLDKVNR
jgi:hypothetical protein